MKTAFLLHGTGGNNNDYFWFAVTEKYLEKHGYAVWMPQLPNTDAPKLQETLGFVRNDMPALDEHTIIVGHSSSCPLILSLLQYVKVPIKQACKYPNQTVDSKPAIINHMPKLKQQ